MWGLDRFSNSGGQGAVPSAAPYRTYSPAPRKSTQLPTHARPALVGRNSSQASLVSNSSAPNQSAQSRPSGSGLKNQLASVPSAQVEDPLLALERLVSDGNSHSEDGKQPLEARDLLVEKPSTPIEDINFNGLSLQEFVTRGSEPPAKLVSRSPYSQQSAEEYETERDKFEELHKSINACDDILKSVEGYLSSFQSDLGNVSAEIETLQSRSTVLNNRLENRRNVEKLLSPTVDRIGLPAAIVKKIADGPIDEAWTKALAEMQDQAKALEAEDLKDVHAVQDLKPLIEDLSDKAAERIKEYFAAQIRSLRLPNMNAQRIQQHGFLKFKPLFEFLAKRQPQLGEEIMKAYSNTMRWYYYTHFTRYHASISKMKLYSTDRYDVIGEDPSSQARHRASATGTNSTPSHDVFSLGRRFDILRSPDIAAIPSHAAEESRQPHHIETPFHSFNAALIDNAAFEYGFLISFFSPSAEPAANTAIVNRHFSAIFSPVVNIASALTKSLVSETYDALGVLMLVRLTQHFAFILQRRKTPSLETYINATSMVLWPRFQVVLDAHCTSLKQLTSSLTGRAGSSSSSANAFATLSGGSSGAANTAPHPVTQRFANFAHAIISLSSEAGDDEPVSNSFGRLRTEYEAFLAKAAGTFGSGEKARKEKKRFLANNYMLVLTVLADARGRMADEVRRDFEALKLEVS